MTTWAPIRPADSEGPVLTGRAPAEALRKVIEAALAGGESVVVDFDGVISMSPSYADELFAKVEVEDATRLRFENLPSELAALREYVIAGRTENGSR